MSTWKVSRRSLCRAMSLATAASALRTAPGHAAARDAVGAQFRVPLSWNWLFGPLNRSPESTPDAQLSTVDLPHTAVDLAWRDWDPSSWERTWLYRRHFDLAPAAGMRYFLDFGGAMTGAAATVNGRALPPHVGGYTPFRHEITEFAGSHNTVEVVVDGRFDPAVPPNRAGPSSSVDFWQPAGLHREVVLVGVPDEHVADVFARPADVLDPRRRRLVVTCELDLARPGRDLRLDVELRRGGSVLAGAAADVGATAPGRRIQQVQLGGLDDVELWSTDSPALHEVVVTLSRGGRTLHEHRVRTGFREARFTRSGFYLNDRRLQLVGLNRHHVYPFAGCAVPARVQRRDAEILREDLNCTMVRCSHYPQHEAFLAACDELGLLVWEEPPGWRHLGRGAWLERSRRDLHDMIVRDRNHPSVVLWAARLNETRGHAEFYTGNQDLAKSLDDSRQTTGAVRTSDHATTDFQHDVFGYNDYSSSLTRGGVLRPEVAPPRADLPYLVSEAVGTLSGPAKYYRRTDPQPVQQDQALAHARVHDLTRGDRRYCGTLAWAGFDYPSGNGNVDRGVKWPGVVDLFRVPKPGAAVYRAQADPRRRPVVEPSFSWDFAPPSPVGSLGGRAAIWSNVDRLELFVGDRHHGSLLPARAEFPRLPHPPFFADFTGVAGAPELRVEGYLDGQLVLTRRFSADRGRDRLAVTLDDDALLAGLPDATRAEIRAVDTFGNTRPHTPGEVALELRGPALLVGANPFPLGETGGAGAVWIRTRATGSGPVTLTAHHPHLGSAKASLVVAS